MFAKHAYAIVFNERTHTHDTEYSNGFNRVEIHSVTTLS